MKRLSHLETPPPNNIIGSVCLRAVFPFPPNNTARHPTLRYAVVPGRHPTSFAVLAISLFFSIALAAHLQSFSCWRASRHSLLLCLMHRRFPPLRRGSSGMSFRFVHSSTSTWALLPHVRFVVAIGCLAQSVIVGKIVAARSAVNIIPLW